MTKEPIRALAPMLDALRINESMSFDGCSALFGELRQATGASIPVGELSGNQWCALMNLAIARFARDAAQPSAPTAPQGCTELLREARNFVEAWDDESDERSALMGRIDAALATSPEHPSQPGSSEPVGEVLELSDDEVDKLSTMLMRDCSYAYKELRRFAREVIGADRHLRRHVALQAPASSDIDLWTRSRESIIGALEAAGLRLMSNNRGFWISNLPQAPAERTGWPGHLLQDECSELSRALANKPGAKRLVKEVSAEIRAKWAALLLQPEAAPQAPAAEPSAKPVCLSCGAEGCAATCGFENYAPQAPAERALLMDDHVHRHVANEWADMAANGLQWIRNIRDGISTADVALAAMEANLQHCRDVNDNPPWGTTNGIKGRS